MSKTTAGYRFSANTGYLWQELPFLDRIRRAAATGFDAVEFHDEVQRTDLSQLNDTLAETGLPVLGINIRMGDTIGSAAMPHAAEQTKRDIAAAADIAERIGATGIHVLAGIAEGRSAHKTYVDNLHFALESTGLAILIEPVCREQLPGYFLRDIDQARQVIQEIDHPRLKILFDCYHVHRESGSILENFQNHADRIGHVQIAAAEDRAEPFPGELDYGALLPAFVQAGYTGVFGCEYRPQTTTDAGLHWRAELSPSATRHQSS